MLPLFILSTWVWFTLNNIAVVVSGFNNSGGYHRHLTLNQKVVSRFLKRGADNTDNTYTESSHPTNNNIVTSPLSNEPEHSIATSSASSTSPTSQSSSLLIHAQVGAKGKRKNKKRESEDSSTTQQPSYLSYSYKSVNPTNQLTHQPYIYLTRQPSTYPTQQLSMFPTIHPSNDPTHNLSNNPTVTKSNSPSTFPSFIPIIMKSMVPSKRPFIIPSFNPSIFITSKLPSVSPSFLQTDKPNFAAIIVDDKKNINKAKSTMVVLGFMGGLIIFSTVFIVVRNRRRIQYDDNKKPFAKDDKYDDSNGEEYYDELDDNSTIRLKNINSVSIDEDDNDDSSHATTATNVSAPYGQVTPKSKNKPFSSSVQFFPIFFTPTGEEEDVCTIAAAGSSSVECTRVNAFDQEDDNNTFR